jgi:glycosyltransferase involved in cell wall biosynthesis
MGGYMISLAITVCNEHKELETLLDYLQERALSPEYEIIIQIDKDNYTDNVIGVIVNRGIKHHFFPLNKDFATYKNELIKHCSGEYIFQIDADELPNVDLLNMLPSILEANPDVDVYLVPRINTVSGITEEHIQKWRWNVEGDRINFPDYQWRIYKNIPSIKWINKVHERLDGFKTYTTLPPQDEFCLLHPKTIERQEKQNNFYEQI